MCIFVEKSEVAAFVIFFLDLFSMVTNFKFETMFWNYDVVVQGKWAPLEFHCDSEMKILFQNKNKISMSHSFFDTLKQN